MLFNPDHTKQAYKGDNVPDELFTFNNSKIQLTSSQKHLRLILDSKVDFNQHLNDRINKCNKIIGIMKRLLTTLQNIYIFISILFMIIHVITRSKENMKQFSMTHA